MTFVPGDEAPLRSFGHGLYGDTDRPDNSGVFGLHKSNGSGVTGSSQGGSGVTGSSQGGSGVTGSSQGGDGVFGQGGKNGVHGETSQPNHSGVWANNSGGGYGVVGTSDAPGGIGVYGRGGKLAGRFEGDVEVTRDLKVQGVNISALIERLRLLEQEVAELKRRSNSPNPTPTPTPTPSSKPQISITNEGTGQNAVFIVSGSGFLPNKTITIRVVDNQLNSSIFQQSSDTSGKVAFRQGIPCNSGLQLSFSASDNRSDSSDSTGVLWSNTFRTTCP